MYLEDHVLQFLKRRNFYPHARGLSGDDHFLACGGIASHSLFAGRPLGCLDLKETG